MTDIPLISPARVLDANGNPASGAKVFPFASGTTTPVTVYTDEAATIPHPTPIVADSEGYVPAIYYNGATLKIVVTDAADVTLYTLDPVPVVSTSGGAAAQLSFSPTSEIQQTNVQAAIEFVYSQIESIEALAGWGVTANAPTLANIDSTSLASGAYRYTSASTGTFPAGFISEDGVVLFMRETSLAGLMLIARTDQSQIWHRRLSGDTWQEWRRIITDLDVQASADWETGTSTTESIVSPAKVRAAIGAFPELLATVTATSGSQIVIADLPDARLMFQFVNVTAASSTSNTFIMRTSVNNGSTFPGADVVVGPSANYLNSSGGLVGIVELLNQKQTLSVATARGIISFNTVSLFQQNSGVLAGHVNAVRFAFSGSNFAASSGTGNPDAGKILVWRMS